MGFIDKDRVAIWGWVSSEDLVLNKNATKVKHIENVLVQVNVSLTSQCVWHVLKTRDDLQ